MSRFWNPVVHTLLPYVPGEQPKIAQLIKLNTNENPYPPSPRAVAAMREVLAGEGELLRLYPDPEGQALKAAIARRYSAYGIREEQIFVGNGSDEVLALVFLALLKQARPLYFPDVTYSFYPSYCRLYGIDFVTVPLDEHFALRADDYVGSADMGAIIFPNPNAPTGRAISLPEIAAIARANPDAPVVIDEAYVDFGADTAIALVDEYPNLLVVQTFSKSHSLAGLRAGFAIGDTALIEGLGRVKNSFNSYPLDRIALAGATAAMADEAWFAETRQKVKESREKLADELSALGFEIIPSAANFLFVRHPGYDAAMLARQLREQRILVRHFQQPRIRDFLRITVGAAVECAMLIATLMQILQPHHKGENR
ncbi:MAG: histidinol-phosphate transaminase [Betaproteobacteria bacterium]|nr:histidinol-phosphate transaminase [Betaproteobacteria bacterium]